MNVVLNGNSIDVASNISVYEILEVHNINPAQVIVELNKSIAPKDSWNTLILKENDSIEVLRFVGGG
ncbi:sulfur carrier protein ThiS [Clostridium cellulovorans]|uniref:Thiamine biosynthesis protein ThiS n=1 Tax=Clostridium cellulovorans (strain ATCC 35296 / DSM 3052 / OCM 3 / 743B) TaxID=573061 RepID=D9SRU0_CLOC7|nr:sulfur carrier protein ThiS [Clostridium cellulovorans]ADL50457.1 thiamine biosynthesis protein ThiS [Clostridium cellulovorans 743B]